MIPKSGGRLSDKIMCKVNLRPLMGTALLF
jgi:hypothetical protein